ncbi:MAG: DUF2656 domain-containing protein [Microcoleus sp. PH2017_40_RAT_O_B]|uniref:DUF2656 domain-containing protein n=1 Tax=unclassified Microcoleus TaxID=2642155 RepID=UPI001DFD6C16|nr:MULTISPECIES: DUF2656 domain-containing protein [unclassified Microcoleus]MCC3431818.1 DUF2656 domain-containing protein [Microcoleus sp. PH2017_04_SCI_O_A]MCC3568247.1 DUF2656 domain-containing protein [Microcoleus sp. PH2017_31_RDM_U_A]MCC3573767.1 DUF2656 domain-containing protein [Microcoleus sp. PH2017_34_RAT_O_A]MCC3580531.1 DUF2656 domain-containing protein [Microcoleus sp. PH2017_32_RDM_D_A]MCC3611131.1 DUF2656 domain-containing protein [Microcoleus sp. PH2017_40_RAT_O_B]
MTESGTGRMLLSHNFDMQEGIFPTLSREDLTLVFAEGLSQYPGIKCRQLNHAHWMVEVLFSTHDFAPPQVGELCAEALVDKRKSQGKVDDSFPDVLILAGLKKTPPLSSDVEALQTGEWGVDVVETASAESFLMAMGWEEKTSGKSIEDVFKVERRKG